MLGRMSRQAAKAELALAEQQRLEAEEAAAAAAARAAAKAAAARENSRAKKRAAKGDPGQAPPAKQGRIRIVSKVLLFFASFSHTCTSTHEQESARMHARARQTQNCVDSTTSIINIASVEMVLH